MRFDIVRIPCLISVIAACLVGCSEEPRYAAQGRSPAAPAAEKPAATLKSKEGEVDTANVTDATKATKAAVEGRKIIYNSHVELVTDNLTELDAKLAKLIQTSKGYISDSDIAGTAGAQRMATWKIRIPVDTYDTFVKAVTSLGELVSLKADSQDVTEEFFDVEARENAKKVEETRLLKHLSDSTGKLEDILAVERELSRVRSEIERLHGRLRALANLTSLTTVTIVAREIKNYVPPQAPTFFTKLTRAFSDSLQALLTFSEAIMIFAAGLLPWLPLIAIGFLIAWLIWKKQRHLLAQITRPAPRNERSDRPGPGGARSNP